MVTVVRVQAPHRAIRYLASFHVQQEAACRSRKKESTLDTCVLEARWDMANHVKFHATLGIQWLASNLLALQEMYLQRQNASRVIVLLIFLPLNCWTSRRGWVETRRSQLHLAAALATAPWSMAHLATWYASPDSLLLARSLPAR